MRQTTGPGRRSSEKIFRDIKRGTPQFNGKVKGSHRSDGQKSYQLLSDKGNVDLYANWEIGSAFTTSKGRMAHRAKHLKKLLNKSHNQVPKYSAISATYKPKQSRQWPDID